MAMAQPAPPAATISPAAAGPTIWAVEDATPRSALACCRRPGLTTNGSSPVSAGLKNACPAPITPARTMNTHNAGEPVSSNAASSSSLAQRATSEPIMTARRDRRSAITPPASSRMTSGTVSAAST